jgi:hypothetical protein
MPPNIGCARRPDRGTEQEPAHLGRAVQPERLAVALGRRRIGEEARAPPGRRSAAPSPEAPRSTTNAAAPVNTSGRPRTDPSRRSPMTISGRARRAVGQPAEDRLADEAGRRPGGDDHAERGQVDALLGEVQRQHRQQAAEPQPDDELGHEQRQDRRPSGRARR